MMADDKYENLFYCMSQQNIIMHQFHQFLHQCTTKIVYTTRTTTFIFILKLNLCEMWLWKLVLSSSLFRTSHMPMMTKYIVTHKPFIKSLKMYAYSDTHNIYLTNVDKMYDIVIHSIVIHTESLYRPTYIINKWEQIHKNDSAIKYN